MTPHTVVLLSGGLDSSTLLYYVRYLNHDPVALSVAYGQRHERELAHAELIAHEAGVPLCAVNLDAALRPVFAHVQSSQVGQRVPVPHGHYTDVTMQSTIVPNRNMLLLAIAAAFAQSIGARHVAYAAHAGDHPVYPDCRPEFIRSCGDTISYATDGAVTLFAPFAARTKADIVTLGAQLHVPFQHTYSCYEGNAQHCGKCGTCVERREAFALAGVPDPTQYAHD
jgi:7-cyano-7-deazaguanine synthase